MSEEKWLDRHTGQEFSQANGLAQPKGTSKGQSGGLLNHPIAKPLPRGPAVAPPISRLDIPHPAGGLLHPLSPRNKLTWRGEEGFTCSFELLRVAQESLAQREGPSAAARLYQAAGAILR
jgi:hypothetical protein